MAGVVGTWEASQEVWSRTRPRHDNLSDGEAGLSALDVRVGVVRGFTGTRTTTQKG